MEKIFCSKCGNCCKHMNEVINGLPQIANIIGEENAYFPYKHKNGICENLNIINNQCSVYENRPIICNADKFIEVIAEKTGQNVEMLRKAMYITFKEQCLLLQK